MLKKILTSKELSMGILSWIILGLIAGALAFIILGISGALQNLF